MAVIGYARVRRGQSGLDMTKRLAAEGCEHVFYDHARERPEMEECLKKLKSGDTLVIPDLATVAYSLRHLVKLASGLRDRGVNLVILGLAGHRIDTRTRNGVQFYYALAGISEMLYDLRSEGVHEGLMTGRKGGRRPEPPRPEVIERIRERLAERDIAGRQVCTQRAIALELDINPNTLSRWLRKAEKK
jgi:DNA invertase Pin-like site-specific DNA recombinase